MSQMKLLNSLLSVSARLREITGKIRPGAELLVSGISDSQKRHLAWWAACETGMKGIYVAWNEMQARQALADLSWLTGDRAVYLPCREIMLYDVEARSFEQTYDRITALMRILEGDYDFVVTSTEALLHRLMPPDQLARYVLELKIGQQTAIESLEEKLLEMGYERVEKVEGKAQYAVRGGILDIFPINAELPARVEFFDIEVDSIRAFSPETQRSIQTLDQLTVYPAREIIYTRSQIPDITRRIQEALDRTLRKVSRIFGPCFRRTSAGTWKNCRTAIILPGWTNSFPSSWTGRPIFLNIQVTGICCFLKSPQEPASGWKTDRRNSTACAMSSQKRAWSWARPMICFLMPTPSWSRRVGTRL